MTSEPNSLFDDADESSDSNDTFEPSGRAVDCLLQSTGYDVAADSTDREAKNKQLTDLIG